MVEGLGLGEADLGILGVRQALLEAAVGLVAAVASLRTGELALRALHGGRGGLASRLRRGLGLGGGR